MGKGDMVFQLNPSETASIKMCLMHLKFKEPGNGGKREINGDITCAELIIEADEKAMLESCKQRGANLWRGTRVTCSGCQSPSNKFPSPAELFNSPKLLRMSAFSPDKTHYAGRLEETGIHSTQRSAPH